MYHVSSFPLCDISIERLTLPVGSRFPQRTPALALVLVRRLCLFAWLWRGGGGGGTAVDRCSGSKGGSGREGVIE